LTIIGGSDKITPTVNDSDYVKKVTNYRREKMSEIKEAQCLVLIKPDALVKSLTGNIISVLSETKFRIVGAKIIMVSQELAEEHYAEHQGKPFFSDLIKYIMGGTFTNRVMALVYQGPDAISTLRALAGKTNPEEADFVTIRGKYGRVNSKTGVFENVIHISDSPESAKREIQLWFKPGELSENIYPTKLKTVTVEMQTWAAD